MDISKLKEELAKMPEQGYKNNMFVGKPLPFKYGKPMTPFIRELAKKHNIPLIDAADVGNIEPVVIDENAKKVDFDTTAFFSNQNLVMFLDELYINGITGETFFNGENH